MSRSSSDFSSQADIDAECRKISLQIQNLTRRHRDLRSQRNELALISRIPNELLQKVFLVLRGAQPNEAGYRQVIQLTHVCRRWRRVGLGQPELWAYITDKHLQAVSTLLDRSKSVPLTVVLCCRSNEHARTPEALLLETKIQDALSRRVLRSLDICNDSEILGWRVGALPGGAPVLHTLRLWMVNTLKGAIELLSTKLPDIFPEGAPLLRRVLLLGCHLPWTSRLFEGLTSLEIHDRHPSIASSAAEFLDALGRMTKLEHLHLDIKVPDSNQPATKDRLVALPSLKSLYVEGSLSECIDFLEHVVIPGSAKVDVSVVYATGRDGRQSAPEGSSLQPRILKPSLDSDANPLASGSNPPEIAFTRSNPTSVIIDTDVDTCGTMRIRENMDLFTVILTSERYNTLTDGGRAVLASLPSTDIRSLAIRLFPREECFKLDELLPVLQSVEELCCRTHVCFTARNTLCSFSRL
ncbi:hypothetical protein CC2G_012506 [Coprinopsis cinerea AmutBmut pab1-1]|nr:hypothetical protein CC2G_012506 [Coprinopsis cinerea AmutBmut pab1-1]